MKTIYAPKWAIDLATNAKRMDSPEARLLALDVLQSQVGCPAGIAQNMVYSSEKFQFKESDCFEYGPKWTHAVFNGKDTYNFKSGKLYPIRDFGDGSFDCLSETGDWRLCLVKGCAHINEGNWTLVNMESEE